MSPKAELLRYKAIVDSELEKYFDRKSEDFIKISPFITDLFSHLKEFTLRGGKRLRPTLLYHSYKAFGGKEEEDVIAISIFIELIQSFLLIHDDIMDHADLRRGGDTIHKIYEKYAESSNYEEPYHFGSTIAILVGDLANQLAFELIADSKLENKDKLLKLLKLLTYQLVGVVCGQVHDILLSNDKVYTLKDITNVHHYKTAKYTYEIPVIAGALLAGATDEEIDHLTEYSTYAGVAFQIYDDILGVFGDDENTGKPTTSDISEGKKTLLTLKVEETGTNDQKEILKRYLGKKDLTIEEAEEVKTVMKDSGALEFSKQACKDYVEAAQNNLDNIKREKTDSFTFLYEIAEYCINRDN